MLSALRQRVGLIPRLVPRQTCRMSTAATLSAQEDEAAKVLEELSPSVIPPEVVQAPVKPPIDLETMHHYIPPAQSPILQLFTTMIMQDGKYASAAKRISNMLLHLHVMTKSRPVPLVEEAVLLASPAVKISRQKKGGGKTTLKPMALSERQRTRQGLEWIIKGANGKGRPGKDISDRLAREIISVLQGTAHANAEKKKLHEEVMVNRGNLGRR
ncbi:hypothetical protein CVT25_010720 [Psilocybe cyanescens]|uniref:Small ribosomal subunit protein uS7 domain-containing protein n=1 Tax=Psilocybe cyanescens TaxID=93625 RepID=A0A409WJN4_PSICY|nr:hypothetical protein CVT25_010720 [Psilocybe cyanescens]